MIIFLKRLFRSLTTGSEFTDALDHNHLAVPNRRRFTSPQSHGSQIFNLLTSNGELAKLIRHLGNAHTLICFAMVGQEVRMLGYRAGTDVVPESPNGEKLEGVFNVYSETWAEDGMFHYLVAGNSAELLIRNSHPHLMYDAYRPVISWTVPLTAEEIDFFRVNWRPASPTHALVAG